ncbi:MAG TPA: hypothetical protein VK550_30270 [Polyangiaceae bacterium]|nr:hypothetical protein [Polyangiaceae bacterium]
MSRARWMLVVSATGFASCSPATPAVNDFVSEPDAAREASDDTNVGIHDAAGEASDEVSVPDAVAEGSVSDASGEDDAGERDDSADGQDDDAGCPPGTLLIPRATSKECAKKWEACPADGGPTPTALAVVPPTDAGICPVGYARRTPTERDCNITACFGSSTPACNQDECSGLYGPLGIGNGYACCPGACYGAPPARFDRFA